MAADLLELTGVTRTTFRQMKDETIFVIDNFGNVLTHLHAVAALGKIIYPSFALLFSLCPLNFLQPFYSILARNRYRLGVAKKVTDGGVCARTPTQEHSRIIL